jgi:hypothetical protein
MGYYRISLLQTEYLGSLGRGSLLALARTRIIRIAAREEERRKSM